MKILKIALVVIAIYIGLVATFESLLGYFQPSNEKTLTITTTDGEGNKHDRVLSRLEADGKTYVAANHWPRDWYNQALDNPSVEVTFEGATASYLAVPLAAAEHARVDEVNALGPFFRLLTGFPPRYFLRLDPV